MWDTDWAEDGKAVFQYYFIDQYKIKWPNFLIS